MESERERGSSGRGAEERVGGVVRLTQFTQGFRHAWFNPWINPLTNCELANASLFSLGLLWPEYTSRGCEDNKDRALADQPIAIVNVR